MIKKNLLQLTHGHKMKINKRSTVQIKQEDMVFYVYEYSIKRTNPSYDLFINIPSSSQ